MHSESYCFKANFVDVFSSWLPCNLIDPEWNNKFKEKRSDKCEMHKKSINNNLKEETFRSWQMYSEVVEWRYTFALLKQSRLPAWNYFHIRVFFYLFFAITWQALKSDPNLIHPKRTISSLFSCGWAVKALRRIITVRRLQFNSSSDISGNWLCPFTANSDRHNDCARMLAQSPARLT